MIQHQGVYLPDGEKHLVDWMTKAGEMLEGRGTYQIKKLRAATWYCREFRTAVDVGAHCGLWSMRLAKMFDRVLAFEPVPAHQECFRANTVSADNVSLFECALGAHDGHVRMVTAPTSSGDTRVEAETDDGVLLTTLDNVLARHFQNDGEFLPIARVDFIKLDCEGYELHALKGATQTIKRCLPIIIVEQKPGRAQRFDLPETGAVEWLEKTHGYRLAKEMSGDYIMVPAGHV